MNKRINNMNYTIRENEKKRKFGDYYYNYKSNNNPYNYNRPLNSPSNTYKTNYQATHEYDYNRENNNNNNNNNVNNTNNNNNNGEVVMTKTALKKRNKAQKAQDRLQTAARH